MQIEYPVSVEEVVSEAGDRKKKAAEKKSKKEEKDVGSQYNKEA